MKLLPSEEKLISSNSDKIILTNYRIQMTESVFGKSFTISIFLENISSIEKKYTSKTIFITLGIVSILIGFYLSTLNIGNESLIGGLVLGVIFFAIWWNSLKHIISISSNGGSALNFQVESMSDTKIAEFIYDLSLAKQNRVNQLSKL